MIKQTVLVLTLMLAPTTMESQTKWTTADEWRDAVQHHFDQCHREYNAAMTVSNSSGVFYPSSGLLTPNTLSMPEPKSSRLRREADSAEACEKTEQRLLKLMRGGKD